MTEDKLNNTVIYLVWHLEDALLLEIPMHPGKASSILYSKYKVKASKLKHMN